MEFTSSGVEGRLQTPPDFDGDIFSSRDDAIERGNLAVQKPVIERLDDLALQDILHFLQIADHSGDRIRFAFDRNLYYVVVAVPVRISGGAIQGGILLVTERVIPANMGGGKLGFSGDSHPMM
jgi:hypothetical protein